MNIYLQLHTIKIKIEYYLDLKKFKQKYRSKTQPANIAVWKILLRLQDLKYKSDLSPHSKDEF